MKVIMLFGGLIQNEQLGEILNCSSVALTGVSIKNNRFISIRPKSGFLPYILYNIDYIGFVGIKSRTHIYEPLIECRLKSTKTKVDDFKSIKDNNIVKIYPNPTNSFINIENGVGVLYNMEICNIEGQRLLKSSFSDTNYKIDLRSLKKGIYLLNLSSGNFNKSYKFVKE